MEFLTTFIWLLCISISRSACPWKCWKEDVDGLCQIDDDYYELSCEVDSIRLRVHACAFFDLITDSPSSLGLHMADTEEQQDSIPQNVNCGFSVENGYYIANMDFSNNCGTKVFEDSHSLMYSNSLLTSLRVPNATTTKSISIDVRCVYDKTATLFNKQISWTARNIKYGHFPNHNFKVTGFGNFDEMFSLEGYTSDLFDVERTNNIKVRERSFWVVNTIKTLPPSLEYVINRCTIHEPSLGLQVDIIENNCPTNYSFLDFHYYSDQIGNETNLQVQFGYRTFLFTQGGNSQNLQLTCDVELCLADNANSTCQTINC